IPILLFVMHSPLAKNSFNLYSFSLAAQVLDVKWKRSTIVIVAGIVAMAGTIYMVFQSGFADLASGWMSVLALWISSWSGVMVIDYYIVKRQQLDIQELYTDPKDAKVKVNWGNTLALFFGIF